MNNKTCRLTDFVGDTLEIENSNGVIYIKSYNSLTDADYIFGPIATETLTAAITKITDNNPAA